MRPHGRRRSCLSDYLLILWILVLPDSSRACPRPCACYVKTEVHCTFRYLNVIPRHMQPDVERINLGYNSLSRLTESDFSGLQKLELLMLHSNEIQTIHEDAFNDLSSLQVLKMSYNKVKSLHRNTFRGLKSLVRLHMDHNKLEFLAPDSFYGLQSLKLVHLEGNALRQLHTDTFVTLRYIQIFKTSSIKHIYLSDNELSTLPKDMFLYLNELEGLYLHGNPLSCDCNLQWITEWGQQARDLIKCKRDRSGQQCPLCLTPQKNKGRALNELTSQDLACAKPIIENIFKLKNVTAPEDGGFTVISAKDFVAPMGSLILNMTDQSGNEANLACNVQRPTKMSPITLERMEEYMIMRTTLSSSLVCSIDYDHIQKLWGILAMYSDSPMRLKRDLLLTKTPFISYKYKQVASGDDVFSDIEADLRAEPNWLMQDSVTLQLDRTATTLSMLHIQYLSDVHITMPKSVETQVKNSWVMIKKTNQTQTEYSAIIGGTVELNCHVMGEPAPNIEWVLPDGSKIRAPYINEEGRITISKDGKFILKAADSFDTGVYHCIATNYVDSDVLSFRITVVEADVEEESVNGADFSVNEGEVLYLPCGSNGVPDASVSWILPDQSILHHTYRDKYIYTNGTLRIQDMSQRERGHFRCLAANQYGLDILTHRVFVKETNNEVIANGIQIAEIHGEMNEGSGTEDVKENNYLATEKVTSRRRFPTRRINTKVEGQGNSNTEVNRRHRISQRFRGHRRPFTKNSRRIDPQRWTEILEKTKKNSLQSQSPAQVTESSAKDENIEEVGSGEIDGASGEGLLPVVERFSVVSSTIPAASERSTSSHSLWTTKEESSSQANIQENVDYLLEIRDNTTVDSNTSVFLTKTTGSPQYVETFTDTSINYHKEQPTTVSMLNTTSTAAIPEPEPTVSIRQMSPTDVTTHPFLKASPVTSPEDDKLGMVTIFNSLTATPQMVITHPTTTASSIPQTAAQDFITASPIVSSGLQTTTQHHIFQPTIQDNEVQVTDLDDMDSLYTTSGYSNSFLEDVVTGPLAEVSHVTSMPVTNPATSFHDLSTQNAFPYQTTTSSYLQTTSQSIIDRPQSLDKLVDQPMSTTTKSPLSFTVMQQITEPPILDKATTIDNIPPKQEGDSQTLDATTSTNVYSTQQTTTTSSATKDTPHPQERQESSQPSTTMPIYQGNELKEGKELIDSSTKSSTKVFLSHTDIGQIYIHSTQKIISPGLPAGSTIISHQQIQIVKDVTPVAPTLRRYGRRRYPGRRRIIRPGRIPNVRIHQYNLGKSDFNRVSKATTPHPTILGDGQQMNQLVYTTAPSTSHFLPTTQPPKTDNVHTEEATTHATTNVMGHSTTGNVLQPSTHIIPHSTTLDMITPSHINKGNKHTHNVTPDMSTTSIASTEGILRTTVTKVTVRPRVSSKVIRRKIPWHRLFGNNQINQREILRRLGKNIQLPHVVTTSNATPNMTSSSFSTVKVSTVAPVGHSSTPLVKTEATSKLYPTSVNTSKTKPETTSKLYPTSVKASKTKTATTTNPITAPFERYSTITSSATSLNNPPITKAEPAIETTTIYNLQKPHTTKSTIRIDQNTSKYSQMYATIGKTSTIAASNAKTFHPPTSSTVISTPSYSTNPFVSSPKSVSSTSPKTATPVTSSPIDSTTRFRFSRRKRPRKKYPYGFLTHNNQWKPTIHSKVLGTSEKDTSTPITNTFLSDLSSSTNSMAQTTPLMRSKNEIPLTTVTKSPWNTTTHKPNLYLQQSTMKNKIDTTTTPHLEPSDNNYISTTSQAEHKTNGFKQTFFTPKNKKILSYYKDLVSTTPFPLSVTAKMISVLTDPSPVSRPPVTQPPFVSEKKKLPLSVDVRPDTRPQRNVTIIAHIPGVGKKTTPHNLPSTTAHQPGRKNSEKVEEIPSSNVFSRPHIMGGKAASFTVIANSEAFIPCEAIGNPTPSILWTKVSSGTFVSKTRRGNRMEVFPNGTLSISSVGIQDRGQYLCVASNQYGSDRLLVTLSVITYPPRILQGKSREITVHSGQSVNIKCQAEGRPFPAITWILANETIASEKSEQSQKAFVQPDGTLAITQVSIYDRGLYKCLATNIAGADSLTVKLQVIAAPPAIMEETRQTVLARAGENVKLHCTAKGNPQPSVHWVAFDGTKVKPLQYVNTKLFLFSNGSLYIRDASPADNGNYECIATSSTGSERRVVSLLVEQNEAVPRIIQTSPKLTELNYGDKLMLNCTATGEPKPRILWRLPTKAVVDQWHRMGNRIQVYANGSLIVQSVNEKDAGDYLCVARNKMGDDIILLKVSISMKPAKIMQKQQVIKEVPFGKDFKVDCKASGSPSPEISWSLPDGTVINNILQADEGSRRKRRYVLFDNGTLYLNKVGMAEEGDYTCYAENTLGRDEMKVHITVVKAAPSIKMNTRTKYEARAGGSAVLHCEANGEPKPKIFWLLPTSDMIASSHDRYLLHENGSLTVNHVKLLDAGEYMCVARNPAGDDTKLLKLDVLATPPVINGLYTNKTIITDSAIQHSRKFIHCRAEGAPPLQIMWIMPDNIYLTAPYHGSRIIVHQNGTLEIRNVRSSDTAEFTCIARNDGGESMLVVQLEVQEVLRRPMFKNPFNEKIFAKPGKMAILNCFADGNPTPEILWVLPNGSRFVSGQKFSKYQAGINGTLLIYSPTKEDAGKYRCAARNKVGYIEKLIILEVGQKPNIFTHPRGLIKGIIGETLSLHCLSDGIPKPSISWTLPSGYVINRPQFNGKYTLLENGTLLIQEATIHDRGNYSCKAKNNAGETSISVSVIIVAYPPRITSRASQNIHTRAGSAVHLNCMAIGIPKPEIMWELPDLSVLTTAGKGRPMGNELLHPQGTLVLQNVRPSDSGIYKCVARNILGTDSSSTYVKVI